jgi:hypothetical protein
LLESLQQSLSGLKPDTEARHSEATAASEAATDLEKATWLQAAQESAHVQHPFVIILILWLFVLFVSFGLFAPRNAVVVAALLVGALAISGAVLLIVDVDSPYEGKPHRLASAHAAGSGPNEWPVRRGNPYCLGAALP